ncbi:MAG: ATP-binding protein [Treponema sp.]|jgi:predicted AAA+ superfamily ATPase|nr:ATP-binding protein [Treponema sp.]
MIQRTLKSVITGQFGKGKVILLMGARQVGKTTLLKSLFPGFRRFSAEQNPNVPVEDVLWLNGDELDVQRLFEETSSTRLRFIFGSKRFVVIDEAQRIKDIGLKLKLIADEIPDIQLVATGSSSFDLANEANEPLTGRKREYVMYPLSFAEMTRRHGLLDEKRLIPHRLVYGYYPEVVNKPGEEREILKSLSDSYLYKDILMWERIKKPDKLVKLLQALAFQIGSQVSYSELGQLCALDAKTTEKYIVLLEQCYVIFRLASFSRNLRNELKYSRKIYFFDNGIRNALIADFSLAETRRDIGALWENFLVAERKKKIAYNREVTNTWFWRTSSQKEIDYIEESGGTLRAFEFKWNPSAKYKFPRQFMEQYPDTRFEVIGPDNIDEFLLDMNAGDRGSRPGQVRFKT